MSDGGRKRPRLPRPGAGPSAHRGAGYLLPGCVPSEHDSGSPGSGMVEGLNYRINLTIRKAFGFRMLEAAQMALYHALGRLPELELAHGLC